MRLTFEFPTAAAAQEFVLAVSDYAAAKASHRVVDVELDVTNNPEPARAIARTLEGVEAR